MLGPTSRPPVLLEREGDRRRTAPSPCRGRGLQHDRGPPSKPSREIEMAGDPERMGAARGGGRTPPPSRKSLQQPAVGWTFWLLGDPAPSKPRETHTTFTGTPPGLGLGALPGQCEAPRTVGPQIRWCFQKHEEMLTAECRKVRDVYLPRFTNKYVQRMNFYGVAPQIEKSNVARVPEFSSSFTSAPSASSNCWDHVTTDFWDHHLLFSEDGSLSNILRGACSPVGSWASGSRVVGALHRAPGPRCISPSHLLRGPGAFQVCFANSAAVSVGIGGSRVGRRAPRRSAALPSPSPQVAAGLSVPTCPSPAVPAIPGQDRTS